MLIIVVALIYERWVGHALVSLASVVLAIPAIAAGAMLKGRIKRGRGDILKLHKRIGLFLGFILMGTFFYGLWIRLQHDEPVLRSVHGWMGLIILLIVAIQVVPSLTTRDRSGLKVPHRVLGYALAPLMIIDACWGLYTGVVGGTKSLVLIHSISGGLAALALIWVAVEMMYLKEGGLARARIASYLASFFLIAGCWVVGGYNYRTAYGVQVRPVILAGLTPWAHLVVMEAKEHIFLFLPIIALATSLTLAILNEDALSKDSKPRRALAMVASLALFMILIIFLMGAIVSNAGKMGVET